MLFTNKDLRKLIVPLLIEQILVVSVGMADVIMISHMKDAAVAGVSLVDNLNILLINIFSALATGGAITVAMLLGEKDSEKAGKSAWQMILFSALTSIIMTIIFMWGHKIVVKVAFGSIRPAVAENAESYFLITALSILPIAVHNVCAALFRLIGNFKITLWIAFFMNLINIGGNAVLIYGLEMGVKGAAIATTFSRIFAAVAIFILLYRKQEMIRLKAHIGWRLEWNIIKKMVYAGVPSGMESTMLQIGKIILLRLTAKLGIYALAANAIANTISVLTTIPGAAIGHAQGTVVAACIGAGEKEQAKYYTRKLMLLAYVAVFIMSVLMLWKVRDIVNLYEVSAIARRTATGVIKNYVIMAALVWVLSFNLSQSLRAAGDIRYSVVVAFFSLWIFRVGLAFWIHHYFHLGLRSIWIAMTIDWVVRAVFYTIRYFSRKWLPVSLRK